MRSPYGRDRFTVTIYRAIRVAVNLRRKARNGLILAVPTSPGRKRVGASNPKNANTGPQKNHPKNSREAENI